MATPYTNLRNWMFDDLAEGKLNNKQFNILCWLNYRADYATGIVSGVSARRIIAEMYPDELEGRQRPSERTIQRELKRLRLCGYITSYHVLGQKRSYKIMLHNYVADRDGEQTVINPKQTMDYRDLPTSRDGEDDGDVTVTRRGRDGDVTVTRPRIQQPTTDSTDSTASSEEVSKQVSEQVTDSLRSSSTQSLLAGRSSQDAALAGTGNPPAPTSDPAPATQEFLTARMRQLRFDKPVVKGGELWCASEGRYRALFRVFPQDTVSDLEICNWMEVEAFCLSRYYMPIEEHPAALLLDWARQNKKGKLAIRNAAQLNKALFSDNPNGLRRQFELYLGEKYGSPCEVCENFYSFCTCKCGECGENPCRCAEYEAQIRSEVEA